MDDRTLTTLEYEALLKLAASNVQSPLGRAAVMSLRPSSDRPLIDRELDRTSECVAYLSTGGSFGLSDLTDPELSLVELQVEGTSIDPIQVLQLQRLVAVGMDLRSHFSDSENKGRYPQLAGIAAQIPDLRRLLGLIRGKILPSGEIDDSASPTLRRIRREINDRRARIYRNLESLMHDKVPGAIQEEIVTIRNGRFVIPVRTDFRGQVPGVMHGLSSSGQTTFVEPLEIIDQNNELVRLREEEEIEISRILLEIADALRANLSGIRTVTSALAEIDFTQAKARLSLEFNCVRPEMKEDRVVFLRDARHPLLEHSLKQQGSAIVPISLEMDASHQTMVISGPNAGGKTIAVKTIGLIALMAQSGLHVPATNAALPVFSQVLADIGDQQSIAANLSTFTAHIRNIAEMTREVSPPALILIDEVGTGTDPDEGAALGVAVVDFFHNAGATTIVTTHYNPIKAWASQAGGVLNASVEFDEETLRPTYRLIVGIAGASAGLEIARRMNLPDSIISRAKTLLDPAQLEANDYLKRLKKSVEENESMRVALEEEREATAQKYTNLDLEFARREIDRQHEFEAEISRVIRDFTDESNRLLNSIQDRVTASRLKKESEAKTAELRRSAAVRLRKQSENLPASASKVAEPPIAGGLELDTSEIHEKDRVRINSLNQEGTVESIDGDEFTVLVGSLRFRAKRDEITLTKSAPVKEGRAATLPKGVSADIAIDENFSPEINVIGTSVDEAVDLVDKFLDEAYLAGAENVRVIHGHGKGTLRKALAEFLRSHTHVERFNAAPANQGGAGATLVELRK